MSKEEIKEIILKARHLHLTGNNIISLAVELAAQCLLA